LSRLRGTAARPQRTPAHGCAGRDFRSRSSAAMDGIAPSNSVWAACAALPRGLSERPHMDVAGRDFRSRSSAAMDGIAPSNSYW